MNSVSHLNFVRTQNITPDTVQNTEVLREVKVPPALLLFLTHQFHLYQNTLYPGPPKTILLSHDEDLSHEQRPEKKTHQFHTPYSPHIENRATSKKPLNALEKK